MWSKQQLLRGAVISLTTDRACANVSCVYEGHATTCMHVRCLSNYVHATTCMHVRMQDLFPVDLLSGTWCIYALYACVSVCLPGLHVCSLCAFLVLSIWCMLSVLMSFLSLCKQRRRLDTIRCQRIRFAGDDSARSVHAQCTLSAHYSAHSVHT